MPFTLTHAVAVLPVAYARPGLLPFSALIIGSMIPDWPLYVPIGVDNDLTHNFAGIFSICLPLGLLLYVAFQRLYKPALFELLPRSLQARLLPYSRPESTLAWSRLACVSLALSIGALSHLLWDSFTHQGSMALDLFPALYDSAFRWRELDIAWYELLQHGSSVVGLPLLALAAAHFVYRLPEDGSLVPRLRVRERVLAILLVAVVPLVWVVTRIPPLWLLTSAWELSDWLVYFVTRAGMLMFVALTLYAVALNLLFAMSRKPGLTTIAPGRN